MTKWRSVLKYILNSKGNWKCLLLHLQKYANIYQFLIIVTARCVHVGDSKITYFYCCYCCFLFVSPCFVSFRSSSVLYKYFMKDFMKVEMARQGARKLLRWNKKHCFIIFKGLSLNQTKKIFLEVEISTLKMMNSAYFSFSRYLNFCHDFLVV